MSINPRRQKHSKKKLAAYIFLLGVLGTLVFFLNSFLVSRRPLFISPIGRSFSDINRVEKILKNNKILFSEVVMSDYSYLINIQNNGQVRLSQDKDIDKQIASLQRILIQLTIEGKQFRSIDFRFSEPVVSF